MQVYIANKMSGVPEGNFPWFDRARDYLYSLGHTPISPADMDRRDGISASDAEVYEPFSDGWRQRLRKDAAVIAGFADAIAFGPDWTDSAGAQLERRIGFELGVPFWRVDPDIEDFHPEVLVGLSGYARVGKDTAAEALERQGWTRRGFAEALREILYATNPIVDSYYEESETGLSIYSRYRRIQGVVDAHGWVDAKNIPEVRQLLQRLGTEAGREILGEDFWVKTLFQLCTKDRIVVPDVRFQNEARSIEDRGGVVIRIEREGYGPVNDHRSEIDLEDWPFKYRIQNDGTPEEIGAKVSAIVKEHYGQ